MVPTVLHISVQALEHNINMGSKLLKLELNKVSINDFDTIFTALATKRNVGAAGDCFYTCRYFYKSSSLLHTLDLGSPLL